MGAGDGDSLDAETLVRGPTARTQRDEDETLDAPPAAPPVADLGLPLVSPDAYTRGVEVARGGMGRIVAARDRRLGRAVALKEILPGHGGAARFEREALLTARLQHPSIVTVYEAGHWPSGEPFYVMRFVEGQPLDKLIAATRVLSDRLALLPNVIAMVEALAYAHAQGVIHRDLKPANVLVGPFGETVVVDWGLAKDLRAAEVHDEDQGASDEGGGLTVTGSVMGTPAFMPPEQARGQEVDARADVYALGAILYNLLCGDRPYQGTGSVDVLRLVVSGPPPRLEQRDPGVPGDLAAIVHKAMASRPEERYATAAELADDLRRFQTGQLVAAHRYSGRERVLRFLRRHRALLSVAVTAAALLCVTAVVSVQRIRGERNHALAARSEAEGRGNALVLGQAGTLMASDPTAALALLKTYPQSGAEWGRVRVIAAEARSLGVARGVHHVQDDGVTGLAFLPGSNVVASVGWSGRSLSLVDAATGTVRRLEDTRSCQRRSFGRMAVSPDGRTVVVGGCDAKLLVWDVAAGTSRTMEAAGVQWPIMGLSVAPDGGHIAVSGRGGLMLLDTASGTARASLGQASPRLVAHSPDGRWLVAARGTVTAPVDLWDLKAGSHVTLPVGASPVFSRDSRRLAYIVSEGVRARDLASGHEDLFSGHTAPVTAVAYSPDGRFLATASHDWTVRLWDTATRASTIIRGHQGPVNEVVFSPDNRRLASSDEKDIVLLHSVESGRTRAIRLGRGLAFSSDARTLATGSVEGHLRLWDVEPDDGRSLGAHTGSIRSLAFSADGRHVVSGGQDATVQLHDLATGGTKALGQHPGPVFQSVFLADGRSLVTVDSARFIVWDVATGTGRPSQPNPAPNEYAHASASGTLAAIQKGALRVWKPGAEERPLLDTPHPGGGDCHVSPDGRWVLTWSADLRLWSTEGAPARILAGHAGGVLAAAFSPDSRWFATSGLDGTVRVWPVEGGEPRLLGRHGTLVRVLAFSPDGGRLASGSGDGVIRLWDLGTGEWRDLRGGHEAYQIAFSPDGASLAVAAHQAVLWDLASGESRRVGEPGETGQVAFSPDSRLLGLATSSGVLRLWRDDVPRDPGALRSWLDRATNAAPAPPRR